MLLKRDLRVAEFSSAYAKETAQSQERALSSSDAVDGGNFEKEFAQLYSDKCPIYRMHKRVSH